MIVEYHRPKQLSEALSLLARKEPRTIPIGGGSAFNRRISEPVALVDLQALGLNTLQVQGNVLELGSALTLQRFLEELEEISLPGMKGLVKAIRHEASYNLRQVGTVAGTLVAASGRSPFATALLALDAELVTEPDGIRIPVGEFLPLRAEWEKGRLITSIHLPKNTRLAYEYVARTPADRPIVCLAAASWPGGRLRVAIGGFGISPVLALDGAGAQGAEAAARSACSEAGDQWASAEYRQEIAGVLARRAVTAVIKPS